MNTEVVAPVELPLEFKLHLNVLHHLGMQLYATSPSVLTELVANAWDADAKKVSVVVVDDPATLLVEDDGHGMTRADLQNRFLSVGYNRREHTKSDRSKSTTRKVMGRKGIGKLAMFSIAGKIEVHTQAEGSKPVLFTIDVKELEEKAGKDEPYYPKEDPNPPGILGGHGTRITLSGLNRSVNRSQSYLVPRLARRFGVIGPAFDFEVSVNGTPINRSSAGVHKHLQFLWYFDEASKEEAVALEAPIAVLPSLGNKPAFRQLVSSFEVDGRTVTVRGFIGTVDQPGRLGDKDESINQISLYANGRLWQEDLLADVGDTRYFNSYIVGEIHADFLDADGIDRATSARESIIQHDPYYIGILSHLKRSLAEIRDQWDNWRGEVSPSDQDPASKVMDEWIMSLDQERDKKLAKRLVTSIDNVVLYNDEDKNKAARKMLYRSTMVAFEKLRVRKGLDKLDDITDVFSPEFQQIFATLDDVEESYFHEISRQRLEIILAFEEKVNDEELEKVIQKYLLNHLWLLDPTWDRIQGTQQEEIILTQYLQTACPDTTDGARLDIAYRMQSGRHVVIELKRPGIKVPYAKIMEQCDRYRVAVTEYVQQHGAWMDGGGAPASVAIYFVLSDKKHLDVVQERALDAQGVRVLTYDTLILSARKAYQAYFEKQSQAKGRLEKLLARLE